MSSRNTRVVVTQTARDDIREILHYTQQEWGPEQREDYIREIESAIDRLSMMPSMGRSRDDIYPGVRSIPVGRHLLYYTYTENIVHIRHVWHGRRNPQAIDWRVSEPGAEGRADE